jgi:hypothetical protein
MQKRWVLLAVAGLALGLGAGCSKKTDFDITKTFDPVNSEGAGKAYTYAQQVDLQAEAGSAWRHRDKVKKIEAVGLEAVMTANYSAKATSGDGSIVLSRGPLETVTIGTWAGEQIPAIAKHSIAVSFSPRAVDLVENALKGDGKFAVEFKGSTADAVSFAADVTLHFELTYKVP